MKRFEFEAELIGTRTVVIKAETLAKAKSIFINEEYPGHDYIDKVQVDHVLSIKELDHA